MDSNLELDGLTQRKQTEPVQQSSSTILEFVESLDFGEDEAPDKPQGDQCYYFYLTHSPSLLLSCQILESHTNKCLFLCRGQKTCDSQK